MHHSSIWKLLLVSPIAAGAIWLDSGNPALAQYTDSTGLPVNTGGFAGPINGDRPLNQAIDLDCVEAGIQVAIDRKFAKADDPLFGKVRNFLRQARWGVPMAIAARRAVISPSLIIKLNQLGSQTL